MPVVPGKSVNKPKLLFYMYFYMYIKYFYLVTHSNAKYTNQVFKITVKYKKEFYLNQS
jgi:hypothetical protein